MARRVSKPPSAAVLAARSRRQKKAAGKQYELEWYLDKVNKTLRMTVRQRLILATKFLKSKVVKNISKPVSVSVGPRGGRVVQRSKPGEFPRAETSTLMRSIFTEVRPESPGVWNGYVGTPIDYGAILELNLDRSFLQRTMEEERLGIRRIIEGRR